ncbi:uncharacterized protein VTP21DRAFT_9117 [Calcarisporiella thermophila]|uniref:uncharacterized protein n=1 Tax=Calcarisporiella thermophila TaxID=911321 RepID=UPI0037431251
MRIAGVVRSLLPRTAKPPSHLYSFRHYSTPSTQKLQRQQEFQRLHVDPYPRFSSHGRPSFLSVQEVFRRWNEIASGEKMQEAVTIAGRISSIRESSSKLIFYDIVQDGHVIQVVASRRSFVGTDEQWQTAIKALNRSDIVSVTGFPGKTKTGQMSVFVTDRLELLAPCYHDIPTRSLLKEPDKRFRNRHIDLLVNPKSVHNLRTRAQAIRFVRSYLDQLDFLEVETPVLSPQSGGANARPFSTYANALDMSMQMRIAPELYLKQLVIGGIDKVYELGKQFRNEGIDADHNPEFTTCELYMAYASLEDLIQMTEDMVSKMVLSITGGLKVGGLDFTPPYRRIDVVEALERKLGDKLPELEREEAVDPLLNICHRLHIHVPEPHTIPRLLDKLISHLIEPECTQPTFLCHHPVVMSPLAKSALINGRELSARFELFVGGKEIVNAYEELNDPDEQRRRFAKQLKEREQGDSEAPLPDQLFCNALEYGLPPTGGWGMGMDRMIAMLAGETHVREVLAFPTMKPLPSEE